MRPFDLRRRGIMAGKTDLTRIAFQQRRFSRGMDGVTELAVSRFERGMKEFFRFFL